MNLNLNVNQGKKTYVSEAGTTMKGENSDLSSMRFGDNVTLFCTGVFWGFFFGF